MHTRIQNYIHVHVCIHEHVDLCVGGMKCIYIYLAHLQIF